MEGRSVLRDASFDRTFTHALVWHDEGAHEGYSLQAGRQAEEKSITDKACAENSDKRHEGHALQTGRKKGVRTSFRPVWRTVVKLAA